MKFNNNNVITAPITIWIEIMIITIFNNNNKVISNSLLEHFSLEWRPQHELLALQYQRRCDIWRRTLLPLLGLHHIAFPIFRLVGYSRSYWLVPDSGLSAQVENPTISLLSARQRTQGTLCDGSKWHLQPNIISYWIYILPEWVQWPGNAETISLTTFSVTQIACHLTHNKEKLTIRFLCSSHPPVEAILPTPNGSRSFALLVIPILWNRFVLSIFTIF